MRKSLAAILAVAALALATALPAAAQDKPAKPIRALLVLGGCCHDYVKQADILAKGLAERANIEVVVALDDIRKDNKGKERLNPVYEKADFAKDFDVIIHDECSASVKDDESINKVLKPHQDGVPGILLHCGMHSYRGKGYPKSTAWFDFTGLASTGHGPQLPIAITYTDSSSPITKGLENWTTGNEELYNNAAGKLHDTAKEVARGKQTVTSKDGKEKTEDLVVAWTNTYNGKTKVFATTLGHNNKTVEDPKYLDLVTRGLLWSVGKLTDDGKPAPGYEAPKK